MEAYHWVIPMKIREIALVIVQTYTSDFTNLQKCLLCVVLLTSAGSTCWLKPYRVPYANFSEALLITLLALTLTFDLALTGGQSLSSEVDRLSDMFSGFIGLVIITMLVTVILAAVWTIACGASSELPTVAAFRRQPFHHEALKDAWRQFHSTNEDLQDAMIEEAIDNFQIYDLERLERILSLLTDTPGLPRNVMTHIAGNDTRKSIRARRMMPALSEMDMSNPDTEYDSAPGEKEDGILAEPVAVAGGAMKSSSWRVNDTCLADAPNELIERL